MSSMTVLCVMIVGLLAVMAFSGIATYRFSRVRKLDQASSEFYAAAKVMLENPDLDPRHLKFVEVVADSVINPFGPWGWARAIIMWRLRGPLPSSSASTPSSEKLGREFTVMMTAAFQLLSRLQPIPGIVIRYQLRTIKKHVKCEPSSAAGDFEEIARLGMLEAA